MFISRFAKFRRSTGYGFTAVHLYSREQARFACGVPIPYGKLVKPEEDDHVCIRCNKEYLTNVGRIWSKYRGDTDD